ncbi:MAG: metallophosphoesterase [Clostridia bacterium]|nr:metallophosphoesterase [Clostridia bacterium]MBQ9468711.1 metallophosphoesterase [Clostridia bacterium]
MKRTLRSILSLILCAVIAAGTVLFANADDALTTAPMHFGEDGSFKILHITDTHLHDDNVKESTRLIALACDTEDPDLVILTGDLASEDTIEHTAERVDQLMQVFESRGIPTAVTFGNHDSENGAYTREDVMALYNAYACSISIDDGDALTGCGTYLIPIAASDSDETRFNLWIFDSGDYDQEGHYANVAEDQVEWYRQKSAGSEAENGKMIYGLAFQHIIVPEIYDALEEKNYRTAFSYPHIYDESKYYRFSAANTNYGMLNEKPCCGYYNHGQFAAMAQRGDVLAMFTGHDHTNAFGVKYQGIDIVNSLSTRYNGDTFSTQYGYRVIGLDENAPDKYETRVVRWYDFVNGKEVKDLADSREDKALLAEIRFFGTFCKYFKAFCAVFVKVFTGRTVRYPD